MRWSFAVFPFPALTSLTPEGVTPNRKPPGVPPTHRTEVIDEKFFPRRLGGRPPVGLDTPNRVPYAMCCTISRLARVTCDTREQLLNLDIRSRPIRPDAVGAQDFADGVEASLASLIHSF
jgi:hypothetical protein